MNFKEWFELQETRFKGLKRLFDKEYPDLPKYVKNDLYNNRVAYTMRRLTNDDSDELAPTVSMTGGGSSGYSRTRNSDIPSDSASRIFGAAPFRNFNFDDKPVIINVSPLDFNENCLNIFLSRLFGFKPDNRIRNDDERSITQRKKISSGTNEEPIIVTIDGDKYNLLEGWHRTMASLVNDGNASIGAPEEQIILLKQGKPIDKQALAVWKKVPIKAFIGTPTQ